jgi:hypothetical protein
MGFCWKRTLNERLYVSAGEGGKDEKKALFAKANSAF